MYTTTKKACYLYLTKDFSFQLAAFFQRTIQGVSLVIAIFYWAVLQNVLVCVTHSWKGHSALITVKEQQLSQIDL